MKGLLSGKSSYEKAKERTTTITKDIRGQQRALNRQVLEADREIQRLTNDIKKNARTNNREAMKTLAKGVVKMRNQKSRLLTAQAQLQSVESAVKSQLVTMKLTGIMNKSTEIMQSMSQLMRISEVSAASQMFAKEMMKLGIIDEMMEEATDALNGDDMEEETDEEVTRVLNEVLAGKVVNLPSVVVTAGRETLQQPAASAVADEEDEEFAQRLQALKS